MFTLKKTNKATQRLKALGQVGHIHSLYDRGNVDSKNLTIFYWAILFMWYGKVSTSLGTTSQWSPLRQTTQGVRASEVFCRQDICTIFLHRLTEEKTLLYIKQCNGSDRPFNSLNFMRLKAPHAEWSYCVTITVICNAHKNKKWHIIEIKKPKQPK